jgi:hypothetical protein
MFKRILLTALAIGLLAVPASAGITTLTADRDNSIYSDSSLLSNGSGAYLFSGQTFQPEVRRALVRFDLGSIPEGATVIGAGLDLWCNQSPLGNPGPVDFTIHVVTADWGEAGSDAGDPGGLGAPADTGDATWTDRFFDQGLPWATAGGDFDPTPSASASVGQCTAATPVNASFTSADVAADVQAWLDDPSSNFGWLVLGDEETLPSARRFASRENGNDIIVPTLTIEYETDGGTGVPATSPVGIALLVLSLAAGSAIVRRRRNR